MEEAYLIHVSNAKDDDGFVTQTKTETLVFVEEQSITRSEFYAATREGIKVKIAFEMRIEDWDMCRVAADGKLSEPTQVKYDGVVYSIVRTYKKDKSKIQLICQ